MVWRAHLWAIPLVLAGGTLRAQDAGSTVEPVSGAAATYQRRVQIPNATVWPAVVVVEFLTHGQHASKSDQVRVQDSRRQDIPWRRLQDGPGDRLRLAFLTQPRQTAYTILYGPGVEPGTALDWPTVTPGLLMETFAWRFCNLNEMESVKDAIEKAEPLGADFVDAVYHRYNPFAPAPEPFFSRYSGTLQIQRPGLYQFFTSSQDCSFLLIDGKLVASAPGVHGPVGQARFKGEVVLTAGGHAFSYLHAASGPDACMVAAWQPPGADKPEPIPGAVFQTERVAHLPSTGPYLDGDRRLHDFALTIDGEAPVEDGAPLLRVRFTAPSAGGRARWSFGDGQTATGADPTHIYLHPGWYSVSVTVPGDPPTMAATSRLRLDRAIVLEDPEHPPDELVAYLPILDRYDALELDPEGVMQLVRVNMQLGRLGRAAEVARAWLASPRAGDDADIAVQLAERTGPALRDLLNEPAAAVEVWENAAKAVSGDARAVLCAARAADIALHDLLNEDQADALLPPAGDTAASGERSPYASVLYRVRADLLARQGRVEEAIAAYGRAGELSLNTRNLVEQQADRGSLSRSAEAFLRAGAYDRALDTLRTWQERYPGDTAEGYLSLLLARTLAGLKHPDRAIALANDLLGVNPESPYADQLLFLAAGCEQSAGRGEQARALLQTLLTDYPGSPLVPEVKTILESLAPAATEPK